MAEHTRTDNPTHAPRRGGRPTLLDVARHSGLSRTTVSDVLNRGDAAASLYSPDTRRRVLESVRTLGYAADRSAQKLARGRSGLIGLILLRDFSNPYFARLADAADREVSARGMRLQLAVRNVRAEADEAACASHDRQLVAQMRGDAVEGLLLGPVYEELDLSEHEALVTGALPTVFFGGRPRAGLDAVAEDADAGRRMAVEHLVALGHRRVGFLCAPPDRRDPTRSDHVYALTLLQEAGVSAGAQWVAWQPDTGDLDDYAQAAAAFADAWLAAPVGTRPTAVLTLNDVAALAALGVFAGRGIRVPGDLSVVGHDNLPEAAHLVPPLTTVDNAVREQVRHAITRLMDRIADPSLPPQTHLASPRLVVRGSTALPRV